MKRLTTDTPKGNFERLMNYAYTKNGRAFLSYAGGKYDIDLCEYVSALSKDKNYNYSPEFIFEDGLLDDYDNDFAILYYCAIQAAQLREALKMYEDKLENRTLIELPCRVGDRLYRPVVDYISEETVMMITQRIYKNELVVTLHTEYSTYDLKEMGDLYFLTKSEAEQKLKELKK